MKHLLLAAVLAVAPAALANELDSENTVPEQQILKAKDLPATVIVRINKNDPNDVQVVHLKEPLKAGKKLANLSFEKVALKAEKTGLAYNSENELDATSSTSSWVFGFAGGRRPYYGYSGYRPYYGYGNNYSYSYPRSYYYDSYYSSSYRPYYTSNYSPYYYPNYSYSGYNYSYAPYYSYSDANYNYAYCGWMY